MGMGAVIYYSYSNISKPEFSGMTREVSKEDMEIVNTYPEDGATNVSLDTEIKVNFKPGVYEKLVEYCEGPSVVMSYYDTKCNARGYCRNSEINSYVVEGGHNRADLVIKSSNNLEPNKRVTVTVIAGRLFPNEMPSEGCGLFYTFSFETQK